MGLKSVYEISNVQYNADSRKYFYKKSNYMQIGLEFVCSKYYSDSSATKVF